MTIEQEEHLKENIQAISSRMEAKYRPGQVEHGGNLWEKSGMLRNIEDELADFANYVPTLRRQLNEVLDLIKIGESREAAYLLEKILSPTCG